MNSQTFKRKLLLRHPKQENTLRADLLEETSHKYWLKADSIEPGNGDRRSMSLLKSAVMYSWMLFSGKRRSDLLSATFLEASST
jgi:hypothetical protein